MANARRHEFVCSAQQTGARMGTADDEHLRLLADKAAKLEELKRRKPGQKGYKRTLKAFLDADAAAQKVLLALWDERLETSGASPNAGARLDDKGLGS
jgi:hypothetical protein